MKVYVVDGFRGPIVEDEPVALINFLTGYVTVSPLSVLKLITAEYEML